MCIAPSLFSTSMGKNTSDRCVPFSPSLDPLFLHAPFPGICNPSYPDADIMYISHNRVRASLLKSTLYPPRFGESHEYAQLALQIIENGYLNGNSEFPCSSRGDLRCFSSSLSLTLSLRAAIRIDGGSRMSKM
jgi:hypothetical protein